MTRLVLLNGLPGVGKSTLAAAWAARRPGTLSLDIDVVRALISGPPGDTAGPARSLGLVMAVEHLRAGHDVVVPQLVARPEQVRRFAEAAEAASARWTHVLVEAPRGVVAERLRRDAAAHRGDLGAALTDAYAEGLREVARTPGVLRLVNDDLARAVAALEVLVEAGVTPGGSAGQSPSRGRGTVR
ncbi:AAA family ATPase [Promicromonospora kroppenstedtii]|uniref:AAA family ATPase n=1 Tax=Promicromonospora kroppenstedtii TaxID=440482 RepID=A0ABW7XER2_9MICO